MSMSMQQLFLRKSCLSPSAYTGPSKYLLLQGGITRLDLYLKHTCGTNNYLHYKTIPTELGQLAEAAWTVRIMHHP